MKRAKFGIILLSTLVVGVAFGHVKEVKNSNDEFPAKGITLDAPPAMVEASEDEIQRMATFRKAPKSRDVAGGRVPDDTSMSDQYKNLRDQLIQEKDPAKLLETLNRLDKKEVYDALPLDLKFAAAQLIPLKDYAGIVYRLRPVLEYKTTNARVVQDFAIDEIRATYEKLFVYYPSNRYDAGFRFFTEPWTTAAVFQTEGDVQKYFEKTVYPDMRTAVERLEALNLSQTPVVWDNKVRYGDVAFPDTGNRYRWLGEPERQLAIARFYKRMHWIAYGIAYNQNGVIAMKKAVSKLIGIDAVTGTLLGTNDGVSRKEVVEGVIRAKAFQTVWTRNPGGDIWMVRAWHNLRSSVAYSVEAWNLMPNKANFDYSLTDSPVIHAKQEAIADALTKQWNLVKARDNESGETTIHGMLSNKDITINLKNFYFSSPTDLKSMMPTEFLPINPEKTKVVDGQTLRYRDYNSGNARGWDTTLYHNIFPRLSNGHQVPALMSVLAEARGTKVATSVLASFVH